MVASNRVQIVWFKRDLRLADHEPLLRALETGPMLPLFVYEPKLILSTDTSMQHLGFARECLGEFATALAQAGSRLITRRGVMPEVIGDLHREIGIGGLWSHEETGNALTYARDQRVLAWCREHGVPWHEFPQTGVVRRLASRDRWASRWDARMSRDPLPTPAVIAPLPNSLRTIQSAGVLAPAELGHRGTDKPARQRGGRAHALVRLDSFLSARGQHYRTQMSSPSSAADACSRISADLAFGSISVREAAHATWRRRSELLGRPQSERPAGYLASLKSFEGRLHWHCHFMQKLESEPAIEFRNVHRGFDGLRESEFNPIHHAAWANGETGVPMVDACMRMLAATGWLNFRMRAMLVSFSSYQLWNHWREPALHLAREFLDYEPGIHYPQVQMQSGVTGINTLRIYNPVKQAQDHDPDGEFVKHWIPALAQLPSERIFTPWTMTASDQARHGCVLDRDYPRPIVDHEAAARQARERIWARRAEPAVRDEARAVFLKHGSRNPSREGVRRRSAKIKPITAAAPQIAQQADLFDMDEAGE